jgi:hypothetical protein
MSNANQQNTTRQLPVRRARWGWKSWVLALVVFVSGVAFGSGLTVVVAVRRVQFAIQHPDEARQRLTSHLVKRLELNADQADRVQEIMKRRQRALMEIRREVQPRVEGELEGMRGDVSAVLNAEQRANWERMYGEVRRNWLPRMPVTNPSVEGNG